MSLVFFFSIDNEFVSLPRPRSRHFRSYFFLFIAWTLNHHLCGNAETTTTRFGMTQNHCCPSHFNQTCQDSARRCCIESALIYLNTGSCLHKIDLRGSLLCLQCEAVGNSRHILCHCGLYACERGDSLRSVPTRTTTRVRVTDVWLAKTVTRRGRERAKHLSSFSGPQVYMKS